MISFVRWRGPRILILAVGATTAILAAAVVLVHLWTGVGASSAKTFAIPSRAVPAARVPAQTHAEGPANPAAQNAGPPDARMQKSAEEAAQIAARAAADLASK